MRRLPEKEGILEAARRKFFQHGFARMDEMARKPGQSMKRPSKHFPGKESIVGEMVRMVLGRVGRPPSDTGGLASRGRVSRCPCLSARSGARLAENSCTLFIFSHAVLASRAFSGEEALQEISTVLFAEVLAEKRRFDFRAREPD